MVSLRRKKYTEASVGGKRRSARLLALEEQKSENIAFPILPVDTWQALDNGTKSPEKCGRRRAREENQEESYVPVGGSDNGGSSSNRSIDRIIEYILDVLELKDTHELFTMPDDIQVVESCGLIHYESFLYCSLIKTSIFFLQSQDYLERVNRPGDFATLRQKHKDRMYTTLEQFENDVQMMFRKAMATNAQDTMTHREAKGLQDQAKQVFQSLKNNRTYSELELSAWHRKYFSGRKRGRKNDDSMSNSCYDKKIHDGRCKSHTVKERNLPINVVENKKGHLLNDRFEYSKSCIPQRRYSYYATTDSPHLISTVCEQYKQLVYNNCAPCYQESLWLFVRNAGAAAKAAAERKCLEHTQRVRSRDYAPNFRYPRSTTHQLSPLTCFLGNYVFCQTIDDAQATSSSDGPSCKLATDELLKLFSLIGTPEFLERSKGVLPINAAIAEPNSDLSSENWNFQPSLHQQPREASTERLLAWSPQLGEPRPQERGKSILAFNTNFQLIGTSDVGQKTAMAEQISGLSSENWKIRPSMCQQPREASTDRLLAWSPKPSEPRPQERGESILAFNSKFQLPCTSDVGQKAAMAELISDPSLENLKIRPPMCQQPREASTNQLKLGEPRTQEPKELIVHESSPFQLGFSQFARAIQPFKASAQNVFAARGGA